jgi:hypothetical protein
MLALYLLVSLLHTPRTLGRLEASDGIFCFSSWRFNSVNIQLQGSDWSTNSFVDDDDDDEAVGGGGCCCTDTTFSCALSPLLL